MALLKKNKDKKYVPTDKERELLETIQERYVAAYNMKQQLGLDSLWAKCQDYWSGDINFAESDDDPASETNIIQPIIESQVSDIVNGDLDILVKGAGPSDQVFAATVGQVLKWVWYHNSMTKKLDGAERDRLNLGNVVYKVYWDKDAMSGRGLPIIYPMSPDSFFPDPKVTDVDNLQDADYIIQTTWYSRRKLRELFGEQAQFVKAEPTGQSYDSRIFGEGDYAGSDNITNDQACLFEYWERKDDGKLRLVYCTRDVILADSDEDKKDNIATIPEELNKYPFVMILGYKKKGRLWGMGDTEQLIRVQDVINDLDDQIRMNARLMGNVQIVVGVGSGINIHKWTNKPGLKVPAKDHTAFQVVQPPYIPNYINNRREKAFYETELISGRSEVVEGRRSGSLRAASAILALQEAGSRRSNHKKLMLQDGLREVMELVLAYVKEFMTVEQAFDITEKDQTEFLWFRGSDLKAIPELTFNENFLPNSDEEGRGRYKPLLDDPYVNELGEEQPGEPLTKNAEFDLEVHIGAGMPNNKSFIYEAAVELHRENIATTEETREVLKKMLNWPIIDPWSPEGTFAGRNSSAEQLDIANSMIPGQVPPEGQVPQSPMTPTPEMSMGQSMAPIDPALIQQLQMMASSGQTVQLQQALNQLPPEVLNQLLATLQGGAV
jgi:hypothetical protein